MWRHLSADGLDEDGRGGHRRRAGSLVVVGGGRGGLVGASWRCSRVAAMVQVCGEVAVVCLSRRGCRSVETRRWPRRGSSRVPIRGEPQVAFSSAEGWIYAYSRRGTASGAVRRPLLRSVAGKNRGPPPARLGRGRSRGRACVVGRGTGEVRWLVHSTAQARAPPEPVVRQQLPCERAPTPAPGSALFFVHAQRVRTDLATDPVPRSVVHSTAQA